MTVRNLLFRILLLGILDALGLQLAVRLGQEISIFLGIGIAVFILATNIVALHPKLYAWRWILPALAGMCLLIIYPAGYSLSVAFTNYSDGHLLSKEQVIQQKLAERYPSDDGKTYQLYLYRNDAEESFRFWLVDNAGGAYLYAPGADNLTLIAPDDPSVGERDAAGIPLALDGHNRLPAGNALRFSQTLQNFSISAPPNEILITKLSLGEVQEAKELRPRWSYDEATDTLTNLELDQAYHAERGNFVYESPDGEIREVLEPGFPVFIGFDNLLRVVREPQVRDPFWAVFVWTVGFAAISVFSTLALGLLFAMILNSPILPLRPLFRSILIIPYAVPGWLLITTWRGLFNPVYGPVNLGIDSIFGISPEWFSDPQLSKVVVLFINMYVGFPYMMIIALGALQSIPGDINEAAVIDGAGSWQRFQHITLPLLLVAIAPLLVASFAFNFNNFTVIELVNNGGPPMGAATVAGHTDILLSYTYRLAFAGSAGTDYGFAAAIGVFIFMIIGPITYFNFRLIGRLEDLVA
jgi:ABC-type sugar transport system permease subunit